MNTAFTKTIFQFLKAKKCSLAESVQFIAILFLLMGQSWGGAQVLLYSGTNYGTHGFFPPDSRAWPWYFSTNRNTQLYAYQAATNGLLVINTSLGFQSLAGIAPGVLRFAYDGMPLRSITHNEADGTVTEFYSGANVTIAGGGINVTGQDMELSVVTVRSNDMATASGHVRLTGPASDPFYQEIMSLTQGSGLLSFTANKFNPIGITDPQPFFTEGTFAAIPTVGGTLKFSGLLTAYSIPFQTPWYYSPKFGQLWCYENLTNGHGTISSIEGFNSLTSIMPGQLRFTFDGMPMVSVTHEANNKVVEFYKGASFNLGGGGINVTGTNFQISIITDKTTDRAVGFGQATLLGPTNDLFFQEVSALTQGRCIITVQVYDFNPIGSGNINLFQVIGAFTVPIAHPSFSPARSMHLTNGNFRLQLSGTNVPVPHVMVQACSSLGSWSTLATNLYLGEDGSFTDTNAVNLPRRFYRLLVNP